MLFIDPRRRIWTWAAASLIGVSAAFALVAYKLDTIRGRFTPPAGISSLAVLPLENLSRDRFEVIVFSVGTSREEVASAIQKAAVVALTKISGPGADAAIAKLAAEGEPKSRAAAIHALADRNDQASVPTLIKYAPQSDPTVSAAAYAALARLAADKEIDDLGRLVLSGKSPGAVSSMRAPSRTPPIVRWISAGGPKTGASGRTSSLMFMMLDVRTKPRASSEAAGSRSASDSGGRDSSQSCTGSVW